MKKFFVFILLSLFMVKGMAQEPVVSLGEPLFFGVMTNNNGGGILNPGNGQPSVPRTPIASPNISQDSHTLYFNNVGYDLTLVLLDEDGEEAYTTFVPAGTTAVVLPSTLSGDYELQLLPGGSFYFYTVIQL